MNRVGMFEKVTFERYKCDIKSTFGKCLPNGEPVTDEGIQKMYDSIVLPKRGTKGSAGYDFTIQFDVALRPRDGVKIPTGVRVRIDDGWWLGCMPRSSLGFKHRMQLDNTVGVIDSDYYYSDNEGHIFIKITNDTKSGKCLRLKAGDKIAQGVFLPYGITYDDEVTEERNGGFGSTGA